MRVRRRQFDSLDIKNGIQKGRTEFLVLVAVVVFPKGMQAGQGLGQRLWCCCFVLSRFAFLLSTWVVATFSLQPPPPFSLSHCMFHFTLVYTVRDSTQKKKKKKKRTREECTNGRVKKGRRRGRRSVWKCSRNISFWSDSAISLI